jgi:SAM-dependent methyltransferase
MNEPEYERMFRNEDHYWWFVSRRELVLDLVARLPLGEGDGPVIVDVGCGTGATAAALGEFGRVVGVDFSPLALACCGRRGLAHVTRGRAEAIPLRDGCAEAIVATDILEHLDDDAGALAEFHRILKPGGHAVITVPAFRFLWSEHDEALMHKRRYVARELTARAEQAGFRVSMCGHALCFLFPLALGRLLKPKAPTGRPPEAQLKPVPPWLNAALVRFQRFETRLLRRIRLPWGLSVVAVLEKPGSRSPRSQESGPAGSISRSVGIAPRSPGRPLASSSSTPSITPSS